MSSRASVALVLALGMALSLAQPSAAAEFPIAVGADTALSAWSAFDGENYLVGLQGDAESKAHITAQLVSPAGTLIGGRISVGRSGDASRMAGPLVAFDGSNHLLVWTDRTEAGNDIYGQFVAPSGALVGAAFPIAATADEEYCGAVAFGRDVYLVLWAKNQALYGQRLDRSGNLLGDALLLTTDVVFNDVFIWMTATAFDGENFLVVWQSRSDPEVDLIDVYGCFVSEAGVVGSPVVISDSPSPRFNPLALAWNGADYFVVWNRDVGPGSPDPAVWAIFGRLVSPAGLMGDEVVVASTTGSEMMPSVACSGGDYLVTWSDMAGATMSGRVFNSAGVASSPPFPVFGVSEGTVPLGGVVCGSHQFLLVATKMFLPLGSEGDVYGAILYPPMADVEESRLTSGRMALLPARPNPSPGGTDIAFELSSPAVVSLGVFDLMGREVAGLVVNRAMPAGIHSEHWDAGAAPAGVYLVRLQAGLRSESRRLVLLR